MVKTVRSTWSYFCTVEVVLFFALAACVSSYSHGSTPRSELSLKQALRELKALPRPQTVDPKLFASLKASLSSQLIQQHKSKFVACAPDSDLSKVRFLAITPSGNATKFQWSYRNEGDCNQDGTVDIGDFSTFALNYGVDNNDPRWAVACAGDNDRNGMVDTSDLEQIGANYYHRLSGYHLERSVTGDPNGAWVEMTDVPFASSDVRLSELRQFSIQLDGPAQGYYRVVPFTGISRGIPSDPVEQRDMGPGDWSMFGRDLTHSRRSPFRGAQTNHLKWSYDLGPCDSSPAIGADGTVYVGSWSAQLYAINPDGTLKWSYPTDKEVYSSPAIDSDGTIYVGSGNSRLYALYPDGTFRWSSKMDGWIGSSPAIGTDGTVYIVATCYKGSLYAFSRSGANLWSFNVEGGWSSPAVGKDGMIFVGSGYPDYDIHAINKNGTLKWSFATGNQGNSSPAIGPDGTVYVGRQDNKLYAIRADGKLEWSFTTGNYVESSPAINLDGTIYVGSDDGKLYAINPDGTCRWAFTTGNCVKSSPAIDADGTIYVGSNDNKFYAINPDGKLKWSYTTGSAIGSSPAIGADGTVYVGSSDEKLYAFGPSAE